jgi:hypothetical protein
MKFRKRKIGTKAKIKANLKPKKTRLKIIKSSMLLKRTKDFFDKLKL